MENMEYYMAYVGKNGLETTALVLHLHGKDINKMKHKRNDGVKKTARKQGRRSGVGR